MSRPMQVSTQQLSHFNTFGFLIFRQLLTPAEVETYRREFDLGLDSWIEGRVHDGGSRTYAALMNETTPFIASLGRDARFASVAAQLLSREVLCIAVDGNYQVGDTGWHPDTGSLAKPSRSRPNRPTRTRAWSASSRPCRRRPAPFHRWQ